MLAISSLPEGHLKADEQGRKAETLEKERFHALREAFPRGQAEEASGDDGAGVDNGPVKRAPGCDCSDSCLLVPEARKGCQ